MRYVPARTAAVREQRRIARSATRRSSRGCVGVRRRTRPRHAVLRPRMCGMRAYTARNQEERARECGGRTYATAASYAPRKSFSCAVWRGVRLRRFGPIRCAAVALLFGQHSVPVVVVLDGLVGAADEQRHGGFGAAVLRRPVQRCFPAGRGGTAQSAHHRPPPTTRRTEGAPAAALSVVHVGARADELLDDRVIVIGRCPHQGADSTPAHGGACGGGWPR